MVRGHSAFRGAMPRDCPKSDNLSVHGQDEFLPSVGPQAPALNLLNKIDVKTAMIGWALDRSP